MNTADFCKFACKKLVSDFVEAKIITEDEASGVGFVIDGAMQAAVQHALLNLRASISEVINTADIAPEDGSKEDDFVCFINSLHPHN